MFSKIKQFFTGFPRKLYWGLVILIGLLILIMNDVFGDEDGFIIFSLFYFIVFSISLVRWMIGQAKSILALKRDKAKMEMLHLKSQVNPHFFFNTLNNLYGLVEKDQKKAQELIIKLSDMMRYSIYEGQNELVPLEDEISYLKNYISLHKNRYFKEVTVNFKNTEDKPGYQIMPLMLIIPVENAFKHGVEKLRNDAFVDIKIETTNNELSLSIENNFDPDEVTSIEGIGLENLKRRLVLGYPKKHNLAIDRGTETYKVNLTLNLS